MGDRVSTEHGVSHLVPPFLPTHLAKSREEAVLVSGEEHDGDLSIEAILKCSHPHVVSFLIRM